MRQLRRRTAPSQSATARMSLAAAPAPAPAAPQGGNVHALLDKRRRAMRKIANTLSPAKSALWRELRVRQLFPPNSLPRAGVVRMRKRPGEGVQMDVYVRQPTAKYVPLRPRIDVPALGATSGQNGGASRCDVGSAPQSVVIKVGYNCSNLPNELLGDQLFLDIGQVPPGYPGVAHSMGVFRRSWAWRGPHAQPQFPPEGLKLAAHKAPHSGYVGELVPQELGEPVDAAPLPEPCSAAAGLAGLTAEQKRVDRHLRLSELIELALPGALQIVEGRHLGAAGQERAELNRLDSLFKEKPKLWHNAYTAYCVSVEGKADIALEQPKVNNYSQACSAAWRKIAPEPKACAYARACVRACGNRAAA